jgi:phytoene/squalene synthetase
MDLFPKLSSDCSRLTTRAYSTSFYLGVSLLHKSIRQHVFNIYGFVRLADEIVDTFHSFDRAKLLSDFKSETFQAIERGISLNPILNSFQSTVNEFSMEHDLITSFFESMEMDLEGSEHNRSTLEKYVYGSAEVVGLMCLTVFTAGDRNHFNELKVPARALGSAFQKINFLRDIRYDQSIDRSYLGNILKAQVKDELEREVDGELQQAFEGIKKLPATSRLGVLVAYQYYQALYKRIKRASAQTLLEKRIRVPNAIKYLILLRTIIGHSFEESAERSIYKKTGEPVAVAIGRTKVL